MNLSRSIAAAFVLQSLLLAGAAHAQYGGPPPQQGYGQGGWDAPPQEYNDDLHRRAFHDGIEAARRDFQSQRPPDPAQHEEFRHPQLPPPQADAYREAYRRGYRMATEHLRGGPGPGPAAPPQQTYAPGGGWDAPPAEFADDLRRNAFHAGIDAARRDFANHIPPDPAIHDEFRKPPVPFLARETYRDAFKRGYFMAVQHMQGGPR